LTVSPARVPALVCRLRDTPNALLTCAVTGDVQSGNGWPAGPVTPR
jgi:hypothetical protein